MYQRSIKKTIYTLNIGNYAPSITTLTYPLMKAYAQKIRADFYVITERKFPDWPVVYEKMQVYDLAQQHGNEWTYYIDSDCLIHPDMFDITHHMGRDQIAHNAFDVASHRWVYDRFFHRDGRHIGSGNWLAIASDWCLELWKPLDDLTLEEAVARIYPTIRERNSGVIEPAHLIDDFTLSRNIAKYGLKVTNVRSIMKTMGYADNIGFLWHRYAIPEEQKLTEMNKVLKEWGITIR
jgi:hypothetical protein